MVFSLDHLVACVEFMNLFHRAGLVARMEEDRSAPGIFGSLVLVVAIFSISIIITMI